MKVDSINHIELASLNDSIKDKNANKEIGFSEFLENAIESVEQLEKNVDHSRRLLAAGKIDNLHKVMIDSEKAAIAVQFTIQIRNKIMDAYNEIMRMQL